MVWSSYIPWEKELEDVFLSPRIKLISGVFFFIWLHFEIGNPSDQRLVCKIFEWMVRCIIKYANSDAENEVIQLLCCRIYTCSHILGKTHTCPSPAGTLRDHSLLLMLQE